MNASAVPDRRAREEWANSLSHGLGLIGALVMTPLLILGAVRSGGAADIVSRSVFSASLVALYLASTGYHSVPSGRVKDRLQRFDHAAIYLLIAGTYTPFTLGVLRGGWGWSLFGVVWGAAALGVFSKLFVGIRFARLSTAIYLLMGWLILIAVVPLMRVMPFEGLLWLSAGGALYTLGVPFFLARGVPYAHFVWHLFVLGGSICHVVAVMGYAGHTA
jgi:hemolysin III